MRSSKRLKPTKSRPALDGGLKGVTMSIDDFNRRDFLKSVAGIFSMNLLDWDALPHGSLTQGRTGGYDAIIIGAGLGGLSCGGGLRSAGI